VKKAKEANDGNGDDGARRKEKSIENMST